jgi:hypothetical protein
MGVTATKEISQTRKLEKNRIRVSTKQQSSKPKPTNREIEENKGNKSE